MGGISQILVNGVEYDIVIYKPIEITQISNTPGTVELGSTVNKVTINWQTSTAAASQKVNGEAVSTAGTAVLEGLSLTKDTTFTVQVADKRGATATKPTTVNFLNGVYYGVIPILTGITSAEILKLTRKLQSGKALTFPVNAAENEQIAYALPSRYGTPNFNVGGFDGGFEKLDTIKFTNASGYTEDYDLWLSVNTGLGDTTVKVT